MTTATLGQVEPFDLQVDDWVLYAERLEQFFVANGITDDAKKVAVLLTVIGGKAYVCLAAKSTGTHEASRKVVRDFGGGHERPSETQAVSNRQAVQIAFPKSARRRNCCAVFSRVAKANTAMRFQGLFTGSLEVRLRTLK